MTGARAFRRRARAPAEQKRRNGASFGDRGDLRFGLAACSSDDGGGAGGADTSKTDEQWHAEVTNAMHASVLSDLETLAEAAVELQAAAPVSAGRGWDKAEDAAAIDAMKAAWVRAREAYEHIEGAILRRIFPRPRRPAQ